MLLQNIKWKYNFLPWKQRKALIKLAVVGPIRGRGALTGETGFYNYHQGGDNYGSWKNFGSKVEDLSEQENYTQEEMAHLLGLSTEGYRKIETGKVSTTLRTLSKISEVTEMPLTALLSIQEMK